MRAAKMSVGGRAAFLWRIASLVLLSNVKVAPAATPCCPTLGRRPALHGRGGTVSFEVIIESANDAAPIDAHVYNHLPPFPIWEWDSKPHLENPAGFLGLPTDSAAMCAVSGLLPHSQMDAFCQCLQVNMSHTEIGKKAWQFAKLQPGRARKRINAT